MMILLFRFCLQSIMNIANRLLKSRKWLFWSFFEYLWLFWLLIEISNWIYPYKDSIPKWLLWAFLIVWLIYTFYKNRPKSHFEYKLRDKDVRIEVRVGDILKAKTLVVPINNKFDINQNWITWAKSVLNSVLTNIYDWNTQHLEWDIKKVIDTGQTHNMWDSIVLSHKEKKLYFVANSYLNNNQRSESTKDDFYDTINQFFYHLATNSDVEEEIAMPLFNSWHGRITDLNRETIIKEMIYLFIETIKSKVVCQKLTIYIHPSDIKKWSIDVDKIQKYLAYNTSNYRDIVMKNTAPEWIPIEEKSKKPSTIEAIKN